jgi:hypothetical protein
MSGCGDARHSDVLWAVTCGLFVQLIVTVAIIIKHPGVVYMLAVAAILPLLLAIAFTLLRSSGPRIRLLFAGISIAILIGFLHNLTNSVNNHHALLSRLQSAEKEIESYFAEYAAATGQDRDSLMILWTYGTDSRCYALWFGNDYAKRVFSKEISQVCPHQVQLNIWNRKVLLPDGWLPIDSDLDWDIIVAAQNILRNYPYLADYSETVISQAKTAYFGNVVFILPLFPGSQAGPDNYPLITVEPSLAGAVGIDPQLKAPWPIEVYEDHSLSFLWLGYGEAEGVAGTLWSDAARQVVLEFEVSPGPSRADQQRTVQLAMQSNGQVTAQRETFDEPLALTFPVQLQPGRNDFQFTVLDEATIPVDGDTRPLLVFLRHITVKSLSGLR